MAGRRGCFHIGSHCFFIISFRYLGKDDLTIEKMKKDFSAGMLLPNESLCDISL